MPLAELSEELVATSCISLWKSAMLLHAHLQLFVMDLVPGSSVVRV
jgi:hypothetical protein